MRGSTRIGLMAISLVCMFALTATSALAGPRFWTDKTKTVALRDVNTEPSPKQPDALEFVNNGTVALVTSKGTINCTELEFGGTVLSNTEALAELAVPFGVAEGDNCTIGGANVPTYFDTLANGVVGNAGNGKVASITVTEPAKGTFQANVHNLKFSQNIPGIGFCTANVDGKNGVVTNVTEGFVEEASPNLNVQFTKAVLPVISTGGVGCPETGELTGNFFLETPSTMSDTAFVG
jgi:hypothetical protein